MGSTSAVIIMNSQIPRFRVLVASLALQSGPSVSEASIDSDEEEWNGVAQGLKVTRNWDDCSGRQVDRANDLGR